MSSPKPIELHLCVLDVEMVDAWSTCFGYAQNVFIHQQDILTRTADAILSPANSFGFMDGGIDLLYSNFSAGNSRSVCSISRSAPRFSSSEPRRESSRSSLLRWKPALAESWLCGNGHTGSTGH
jgi:hypothetical protein